MIDDLAPEVPYEDPRDNKGGRVVAFVLLGLVLLLGAGYAALYVAAGDKVPRGASVEGVKIGGLHPAAASTKLQAELGTRSKGDITLSYDGKQSVLTPTEAGLEVDYEQSVRDAGGHRNLSPARLWDYFTGGDDVAATLAVDDAKLDAGIAKIAATVDKDPVEGTITFKNGAATAVNSTSGSKLDRDSARRLIESTYLHDDVGALPVDEHEAQISDEAVDKAMADFGLPAMSGPVTLVLSGKEVQAPPRLFGQALSMIPVGSDLKPVLDAKKLINALEPVMTVGGKPQDAGFKIVDGKPQLIPAKVGVTFDPADLEKNFLTAAAAPKGQRKITVKGAARQPSLTTAEARKLGIKERVSTFTTQFPYAEYRNVNLSRAANLINGTLLEPGETFSLNGIVGERTKENGFTEGYIIQDGIFKQDLGGGVSQIATTTFNAMFFAGLQDVQHKPHSVFIDRYPEGREATVAWPSLDLAFKNDTPYGIFVTARVDKASPDAKGSAIVSMYSTKLWDIGTRKSGRYDYTSPATRRLTDDDCESATGSSGFSVDVFRDFRKAGSKALERTEKFHTVYIPADHVICVPKPKPTPTATPKPPTVVPSPN